MMLSSRASPEDSKLPNFTRRPWLMPRMCVPQQAKGKPDATKMSSIQVSYDEICKRRPLFMLDHHDSCSTSTSPGNNDSPIVRNLDSSSDSVISEELYGLVESKNWNRVLQRCRTAPTDAMYKNPNNRGGDTPLHVACRHHPPVRVVRELLHAYEDQAVTRNSAGELPIYIACRHNASTEVIRELAYKFPGTVVGNASLTATCLLDGYHSVDEQDTMSRNETAFHGLWMGREATNSNFESENFQTAFWQKCHFLIQATAVYQQSRYRHRLFGATTVSFSADMYMMHAAVYIVSVRSGPPALIGYVLQKFPNQIYIRDRSGRLPLHWAVLGAASNSNVTASVHLPGRDHSWNSNCPAPRLEELASKVKTIKDAKNDETIASLLNLYPRAARLADPNEPVGRYPLHTALCNGIRWHSGIEMLCDHAPEAVIEKDPILQVYPFLVTATWGSACNNASAESRKDLDNIFRLLQRQPALLEQSGRLASAVPSPFEENLQMEVESLDFPQSILIDAATEHDVASLKEPLSDHCDVVMDTSSADRPFNTIILSTPYKDQQKGPQRRNFSLVSPRMQSECSEHFETAWETVTEEAYPSNVEPLQLVEIVSTAERKKIRCRVVKKTKKPSHSWPPTASKSVVPFDLSSLISSLGATKKHTVRRIIRKKGQQGTEHSESSDWSERGTGDRHYDECIEEAMGTFAENDALKALQALWKRAAAPPQHVHPAGLTSDGRATKRRERNEKILAESRLETRLSSSKRDCPFDPLPSQQGLTNVPRAPGKAYCQIGCRLPLRV